MYSDTCFTAQALVRLMLDLQDRFVDVQPNEFDDHGVPRFEDVYGVFMLLTENILGETVGSTSQPIVCERIISISFSVALCQTQENCCKSDLYIRSNKRTLIGFSNASRT